MKKKKQLKKIYVKLIAVILGIICWGGLTQQATASEFQFSVNPIIPENQVDKTKTYFDLQMKKNQQQKLEVVLRNDTTNVVKVDVGIDHATTNSNGVVEYSKRTTKKDSSLRYPLESLVEYPEMVTLEPQSEKKITIQVQMPNEDMDGVLAGGITFREHQEKAETAKEEKQKGMSITNEYAYVVALLMRQNTNKVTPKMALHDVKPSQKNARNVILANLQNSQATYINQVKVQAEISKKGSSKVVYQAEKEHMQVAPNSNFDFPVALNGQKLKPGNYHIKMTVYGNKDADGKYQDPANSDTRYNDRWVLEKDFEIKATTAKQLNDKDVSIQNDFHWIFWIIGCLCLVALLVLLFILWKKKRKDEKDAHATEKKEPGNQV